MTTGTLFLIRCKAMDEIAERLVSDIAQATGLKPVLVCDERSGDVAAGGCPKVTLASDLLDGLGLQGRPENWGWLCGDFCYYAAERAHPGYNHYALIESDVFVGNAAAALTSLFLARPEAALAVGLGRYPAPRKHSRGLSDIGLDPALGCIFPVTRVQRDAIPAMLDLRRETLARSRTPVNDEAILAASVVRHGLSFGRLEQIAPDLFAPACFDTNPPHLFEALSDGPGNGAIHHPVVPARIVLDRLASGEKAYDRHRLRRVLKQASPALRRQIDAALRLTETRT